MGDKADFCPFCGNTRDDDVEGVVVMSYLGHLDLWWAYVKCQHCNASGPTYGEEDRTEAIEAAVKAWNDSGRPGWWKRNITLRWIQLCYDLSLFKERVNILIRGRTPMSLLENAPVQRQWTFADIRDGDTFWLSADRQHPHHCLANFGPLNADGRSRDFTCLNGAWKGTLTEEPEEGALELHVHVTGSRHLVYIMEHVESEAATLPGSDEVAF